MSLLPVTLAGAEGATTLPAKLLKTQEQRDTVDTLVPVGDSHTFYTLDYTADYRLNDALAASATNLEQLTGWIATNLLASSDAPAVSADGGCSAFLVQNEAGEPVYGRNYDYVQSSQNILVHCAPKGDYQSYSMVAGGWVFNTPLDDGETDLSLLMAAPYLLMDGMNEKGLMVSVLKLDGNGTAQLAEGKNSAVTTVAMRLALDRAANVEEALNLFSSVNMYSAIPTANFHFFIADAKGDYCILEYAPQDEGARARGRFDVTKITNEFFRAGCDGSDENGDYRMVTNFYTLSPASEAGYDDGQHGLDRYEILVKKIKETNARLSEAEAMALLGEVYQDYGATPTHETQWSVVYNPVAMTATVCPRAEQTDNRETFYKRQFTFDFNEAFSGK